MGSLDDVVDDSLDGLFSTFRFPALLILSLGEKSLSLPQGFAGHLIDLTVMQLRLTIHEISEEELSEFSKFLSAGFEKRGEHQD